jgi:hypothetical protein
MNPLHDRIARRAYELYEARGQQHGYDWADWFQAEREIMSSEPQPKAVPRIELIKTSTDKWKIALHEFEAFREQIGPDVLNAFARCLVHADRLQSMISFLYLSEEHHGRDSVAFERNLSTAVLFTVGTLRELALAIKDARSALAKRGWLDPNSDHWIKLRGVEDRWEGDKFYREKRNTIGFHVDEDVIEVGLQEVVKDKKIEVLLARGDSRRADATSLSLGELALINGMGMDLEQYETFVTTVGEDHGIGEALQLAFLDAVNKAGIQ